MGPGRAGASRGELVIQDTTRPRKQSTCLAFTFWRGTPRSTADGKGVVDQAIRQMRSIRYRSNLRQIQSRPSERYQSCSWPTAETFAIEKRLKMRWRAGKLLLCGPLLGSSGSGEEERLQAVLWEMEIPRSRVSPEAKGATHGDGVRPDGGVRGLGVR